MQHSQWSPHLLQVFGLCVDGETLRLFPLQPWMREPPSNGWERETEGHWSHATPSSLVSFPFQQTSQGYTYTPALYMLE
jgi:hypothetical protein